MRAAFRPFPGRGRSGETTIRPRPRCGVPHGNASLLGGRDPTLTGRERHGMVHGGNVIDELMADHREVEEMFARIQAMTAGGQQLRDLLDEVTIELVRHSVAEEQYLYPAVREHLDGGDRMADKEIADHSRVEKLL